MKRDCIIFGLLRYVLHGALIVIALMLIKEYSAKCYDLGYRVFKEPAVTMVGEGGRSVTITITDKRPREIPRRAY